MNKEELLKGLNDRQREAVECLDGPLLILAGAGSGKTRILTHRIANLIENGVSPWNILAITFTNKAANEMRERVDRLLNSGDAERVFVSTFHSMCVRILRRDIDKLGYDRDFTIYDADDQKTLIRQCIKALNLDTKTYRERPAQNIISSCKNQMLGAEEYEADASDFYERNIARIYKKYEEQLKANNALDFDDLLVKTVDLFKRFPEVLEAWQERFRYIMVDEYQDTNGVQFQIVKMLAAGSGNLCVVGDDDQSIYKFRGADITNILSFEKSFPGARVIKLEQNYRSTKSILNAANEVIRNNKGRKDKRLWTENEQGELPVYREYETAAAEADGIVRLAVQAKNDGVALKDQAILYRTNAQSRLLEERCVARDIPYVIVGGVNFYQRREIKDILSYLRVVANGVDDLACLRIINVPKRGIGQTSVDRVSAFAAERGISFYDALKRCDEIAGFGAAAVKKLKGFVELIEGFRAGLAGGEYSIRTLIEAVRDDTGYADELKKEDPVTAETRLENIEELINKAVSFEEGYTAPGERTVPELVYDGAAGAGGGTDAFVGFMDEIASEPLDILSVFLEEISLVSDIDRTNPDDDVLTMMTLHAAKGLEFDRIYLAGMEDGLFPSSAAINADNPEEEIEEERRLCYVGFTRARKVLNLSSARERMVNGDTRFMKPSRFIDEIPDDAAEKNFRGRHEPRQGSFAGFGGYEGRLEYESRSGGYGAYNAFNSDSSYGGVRSVGRFGSLDTTPAGRNKSRSKVLSSAGIGGAAHGKGAGAVKGNSMIKQKPDYDAGDRVIHTKFGLGTVVSIDDEPKDYKVTVDFDEAGRKIMYAGFAKLKKI
ncbi:MAG: UvrD-helicase domain-containing protein [Eubacteriales bacterium]|nr:UvrD-helicase domain-containing protein [Eubacteriales bacterium]